MWIAHYCKLVIFIVSNKSVFAVLATRKIFQAEIKDLEMTLTIFNKETENSGKDFCYFSYRFEKLYACK